MQKTKNAANAKDDRKPVDINTLFSDRTDDEGGEG